MINIWTTDKRNDDRKIYKTNKTRKRKLKEIHYVRKDGQKENKKKDGNLEKTDDNEKPENF